MIHDLTAHRDFNSYEFDPLRTAIDFLDKTDHNDNLTTSYNEIVLTGSRVERKNKRYVLNYKNSIGNICDCCGSSISIKPWNFEENKTLCSNCESFLEKQHKNNQRQDGTLLEVIIDDSFKVKVIKPWDINDFERESPINNVLLWD